MTEMRGATDTSRTDQNQFRLDPDHGHPGDVVTIWGLTFHQGERIMFGASPAEILDAEQGRTVCIAPVNPPGVVTVTLIAVVTEFLGKFTYES